MSAMPTTPPMMQNSQSGKAAPKSTSEGDIEQPPSRILASNSACLGRELACTLPGATEFGR